MHEWSLASAIVRSLLSFMSSEGLESVDEVEVTWGEVMELDSEIFEQAFKALTQGTPLEGAKLSLKVEKALFRCNSCGAEWDFERVEEMLSEELGVVEDSEIESPLHFLPDLATTLLRCPECGSRDFELVSGKGIRVSRVVA